jgi:hypothetical protein
VLYFYTLSIVVFFQCITNGINYDKLRDGSGKRVKQLEMFFFGFPEIVGMSYFPNLVVLCIMGQDTLDKIQGLESLFHLEELWICEAKIQVPLLNNPTLLQGTV